MNNNSKEQGKPNPDEENTALINAYNKWRDSPEGQKEIKKANKGLSAHIPDDIEVMKKYGQNPGMNLEVTKPYKEDKEKTYFEKAAEAREGILSEGKEAGKLRSKDINDIGQQQLQLSHSGANLDRIIEDINTPEF